jgi:acyl carrier protein
MDESTRQKILNVLSKEANADIGSLDPDQDYREQVNLDSIQFIAILARLEGELNIEIPIAAMEVSTLNEFLTIIDNELP